MAPPGVKPIIMAVVSLMVIALMFPLGLGLIAMAGDYVVVAANATGAGEAAQLLSDVVDPSVIMLLTVLLPILAVIGVIMYFVPSQN